MYSLVIFCVLVIVVSAGPNSTNILRTCDKLEDCKNYNGRNDSNLCELVCTIEDLNAISDGECPGIQGIPSKQRPTYVMRPMRRQRYWACTKEYTPVCYNEQTHSDYCMALCYILRLTRNGRCSCVGRCHSDWIKYKPDLQSNKRNRNRDDSEPRANRPRRQKIN